jgi:hypothetical protein
MRSIRWFLPLLLLTGCASTLETPGGTIRPDSPSPTSPGAPIALEISCHVFYRDTVEESPDEGETVTLVSDGDETRVERARLTFLARYSDDGFEGRSLSIHVTQGERSVTSHLYQLRRDAAPVNEFQGGQGFTGLAYAYSADGAEMQHWCDAHVLRDQ